jgi:hypothetical protein
MIPPVGNQVKYKNDNSACRINEALFVIPGYESLFCWLLGMTDTNHGAPFCFCTMKCEVVPVLSTQECISIEVTSTIP